ncbi:MAG: hypothetical protein A2934_02805 [Candidatus Sungbacteria bacterium RIFCSPLOWO2_01_FULL_47_10]|uniref:General secretion pathway GspH domain-containing protein n=1 Tax=Candidatus Sungbacteria bacterium RIFCSPLOWO2_01_FULL_47_10 TaxID=1802276 RepID=A0A1G2L0P3_9BACT|nr:MAG: hypothetical protein A2934_02805 [Candidatus Sungbacteria bacterium RIFCSPLOWO2_01_FULL_47_10]
MALLKRNFFFCKGFTTVELLLVLGIVVLLAAGAVPLMRLQTSSRLNDASSEIVQLIRMARVRARSGLGDADHGVFFNANPGVSDTVILYRGPSYASRISAFDRMVSFSDSLEISTTIEMNDTNFSKGTGVPSSAGDVLISHSVGGTRTITVNEAGMVEER